MAMFKTNENYFIFWRATCLSGMIFIFFSTIPIFHLPSSTDEFPSSISVSSILPV